MRTIQVTDDLELEVWYPGGKGDVGLVLLRSRDLEGDRDNEAGVVILWPGEIRHLIEALAEAAGLLAEGAA